MSDEISILVDAVRWIGFIIFIIGAILDFFPLIKRTKKLTKSEKEFCLMGFSLMGVGFFLLWSPFLDILDAQNPLNLRVLFLMLFLMGMFVSIWSFRFSFRKYKKELKKEQEKHMKENG